jgi:hypothetical protein
MMVGRPAQNGDSRAADEEQIEEEEGEGRRSTRGTWICNSGLPASHSTPALAATPAGGSGTPIGQEAATNWGRAG